MNIEVYFWLLLAVIIALIAGMFAAGYKIGSGGVPKGGVFVGVAILAILAVVFGGAKLSESKIGPLITYEGAWLASALNFGLVGGYLAGKNRKSAEAGKRALPVICAVLSLGSLFLMGSRLHNLVEIMQQLGIGAAKAKPAGPDTSLDCDKSLAMIYLGFVHYVEVNDALPPADKWMDEEDLKGGVAADEWFHCPAVSDRKDDKFGYAYNDALANRKLGGKKLSDMPDAATTPLAFDSATLTKNAHDPMTSLPRPGRHGGRNNILFCDGHIEIVAPK
jgi:prepilin-type processing-associated H-X9-DG protein